MLQLSLSNLNEQAAAIALTALLQRQEYQLLLANLVNIYKDLQLVNLISRHIYKL